MKKDLSNQKWLITGISSGIGLELAKQLLEMGARVIGIVRSVDSISWLIKTYPDRLSVYYADVSDLESLESVVVEILSKHQIDIFVSNAGIAEKNDIERMPIESIRKIINTNLLGSMIFIKACIPYVKKHGGKIIQIGSIAGQIPFSGWASYCASKYGITGFCESVNKELEDYSASVMIVEPGNINTPLWKKMGFDDLSSQSVKIDISLNKLCRRIISTSQLNNLPLYLPLGKKACSDMLNSLEQKIKNHQVASEMLGDVDEAANQKTLYFPNNCGNRNIYIWPVGEEIKKALKWLDISRIDDQLKGFIESDNDKIGKWFCGREIVSVSVLDDLSDKSYVIISSKKLCEEISEYLEKKSYEHGKDFCYWRDLLK